MGGASFTNSGLVILKSSCSHVFYAGVGSASGSSHATLDTTPLMAHAPDPHLNLQPYEDNSRIQACRRKGKSDRERQATSAAWGYMIVSPGPAARKLVYRFNFFTHHAAAMANHSMRLQLCSVTISSWPTMLTTLKLLLWPCVSTPDKSVSSASTCKKASSVMLMIPNLVHWPTDYSNELRVAICSGNHYPSLPLCKSGRRGLMHLQ